MRTLITGAAGQLGKDLALHCISSGDDVFALSRAELNIADRAAVDAAVSEIKPEAIVNCAAWTAVDACEAELDKAEAINGHAVAHLAEAARGCDAHLVQVSTDYVFDGTKESPYDESDVPNPTSAYGRSKLLGERCAGTEASVVRTSWVYSAHGNNMVATICRLADAHPTLRFVSDQVGRPTFTVDLAVALRKLAVDRASGIWHCANRGSVSWYGFAREVLVAMGEAPERVLPIATADLDPPRPAPRPANSVLATGRYESQYGRMRDFRESLASVVPEYLTGP